MSCKSSFGFSILGLGGEGERVREDKGKRLADWACVRRYNAGHLIEAALAHSNYYKNNLLLEVLEKYVKYISTVIGPGPDQVSKPLLRRNFLLVPDVCVETRLPRAPGNRARAPAPVHGDGQHGRVRAGQVLRRGARQPDRPGGPAVLRLGAPAARRQPLEALRQLPDAR